MSPMILLTLNVRGVGGTLKLASMCRLLNYIKPDIIFLQETLVDDEKARKNLLPLHPTWMFSDMSSVEKFDGLLVAWNLNTLELLPFHCVGGILLTCVHLPEKRRLNLINVYGPCSSRR